MLKIILKIDSYITRIIELLLTGLFILIFLMVLNQVILRYFFSSSIMGTAELFTVFFTYCSALGAAVMVRQREHIKISYFINKFPLSAKKIIITINYILIAVFNFVVLKESFNWLNSIKNFYSQVTGISRAVESISIPLGSALIIFYCIYNIFCIYLRPEVMHLESLNADLEVKALLEEAEEADRQFLEREKRKKMERNEERK